MGEKNYNNFYNATLAHCEREKRINKESEITRLSG